MKEFVFYGQNHYKNCIKKILKRVNVNIDQEIKELDLLLESAWQLESSFKTKVDKNKLKPLTKVINIAMYDISSFTDVKIVIEIIKNTTNEYIDALFSCDAGNTLENKQKYSKYFIDGWYFEQLNNLEFEDINKNAIEILYSIAEAPGVYKIYDKNKALVYIGKSYSLGKRLISSLQERKGYYFNYAITENKADADIYEMYYIAKLQPALNGTGKTGDVPTIKLEDLKFTEVYQYIFSI